MNVSSCDRALLVAGRVLMSLIFLESGYGKIANFAGTSAFMEAKGMPLVPLMLTGAIAVELLGGLSLLLGLKPRWGALALFLFLIPTTLIFHNFWAVPDAERAMQQISFMKNITIMGGLLAVASAGSTCALEKLLPCCCKKPAKENS